MEMWLLLVPTRLGGDGRLVLAAAALRQIPTALKPQARPCGAKG